MIRATIHDRETLRSILHASFRTNDQSNWLASGNTEPCEKVKPLLDYTIDDGLRYGQIYMTDCRNGIAIWKRYPVRMDFRYTALLNLRLITQMGLRPVPRLLRTEAYVERQRPRTPYWYLWMLGVRPDWQGRGLGSQLMDPMLNRAQSENLPVFLETSSEKNVALYTQKGFAVYHEYRPDPARELHIRFLKKAP